MQTLFKKVERAVKQVDAGISLGTDERVQLQIALKALVTSTRLFPSSLKNILAGKQGPKKDNVT